MTLSVEGVARAIKAAGGAILRLILPDDCRICGKPLSEFSRIPVCGACLAEPKPMAAEFCCVSCRTPFVNPAPLDETGRCMLCRMGLQGFDTVYSYGSFEGTLRQLVHLFKYAGVHPLGRVLADRMALALPREQSFDVIVPMPLHWIKRWRRGFNQADLLAREIGRCWNVRVRDAMLRTRPTPAQASLTNAQRRLNMRGAFRAKRGARFDGQHVLLVDDVLTTGATAAACARALKRAGAARVSLLTLARTDRRLMLTDFPNPPALATVINEDAGACVTDLASAAGSSA